ncbi:helix-turn-helix domain-containing protein [Hymenobacter yonginensis]|uniref:Helix-turn-helix transcriptional regulator n=1 Tax=Hymenobacter yonginensis TaxID=748197 RepID=A0ABY7PK32_9BACT|nr:helix-turn-helix transcriptional regulator [Hymenobacter yonginensis]WBO83616.1 helix-turn-helix transcriptional regulator [Hymenobacter yonginensis]
MGGEPITAFGLSIKQLRKARGMSQEVLADEAKLDRTYISQLETGSKQPSLTTIFRLAAAMSLQPSDLLRHVEDYLNTNKLT